MKKNILYISLALLTGFALGFLLKTNETDLSTPQHKAEKNEPQATIWTCSMHPQIRQPEPGQCPICGMDLIPLDETASSGNAIKLKMSEEAVKLAQIQTSLIGKESEANTKESLKLDGKIQIDERRISTQSAHLNGRIEKLFVSFTGEYVRKGQQLAEVYAPDLIAAQQELHEAKRMADSQPQLLEAARNKLRYWKLSDEQIEQLEQSTDIIERFPIYADHSGIITKRLTSVGDYIKTGDPLYEVADLRKVWAVFDAYETDLPKLHIGQQVSFTTPALPNQTFKARISYIDPVVNPKTRSTAVRAEVVNSQQLLKPEMLLQGMIQNINTSSSKNKKHLLVPKSAVLWTGTRSVVYVQVDDSPAPAFEFREVILGERIGNQYKVIEGLQAGERVVTYGAFAIDAAAQLNNQSSMMNRLLEEFPAKEKQDTIPKETADFRATTPKAFQEQLGHVVQAYLELKDALVESNSQQAAQAAQKLLTKLSATDMKLLKGDAHMLWMELLKGAQQQAQNIGQADEIEAQRKAFGFLSAHLVEAVNAFGLSSEQTIYLQHCPMAMDNRGADWLSQIPEIQNPYFGEAMLKCGSTVKTLQ